MSYRLKTKPFGIDEYRAGAFPIGNQKPLLTESFGLLVQGNFGRIALKNSRGEEVVIEVTVDSITVDRSKSGDLSYFEDVDPKLFKKEDLLVSTTKRYMRGNVNMEIIFDVSYLEIYADGGLETASVCVYPDAPYQVVSTDGDLEVKCTPLKNRGYVYFGRFYKNDEKKRLQTKIHFSPEKGWMNDPNGMVYVDGVYHFFYQKYPYDTSWGPMHWGHATSRDLIHWEHQPIALYPDELGFIFSGSAVYDYAEFF